MATKTRRASTALAPRRAASVSKTKYEGLRQRLASQGKRLRAARQEDTDALAAVGTAVALGLYERGGRQLPTVAGVDPLLLWGPALWLAGRNMRTKTGGMLRSAGMMAAGIGVNRSTTRGSLKVGEDDSDLDDESDEL